MNAAKRVEQAIAAVKNVDALKAGGEPVTQVFTATGELPAVELQTGDTLCGGLVEIVPTYAFDWSGDAKSLTLFAEAGSDTTLLVRTPGGSFLCADDGRAPVMPRARATSTRGLHFPSHRPDGTWSGSVGWILAHQSAVCSH